MPIAYIKAETEDVYSSVSVLVSMIPLAAASISGKYRLGILSSNPSTCRQRVVRSGFFSKMNWSTDILNFNREYSRKTDKKLFIVLM